MIDIDCSQVGASAPAKMAAASKGETPRYNGVSIYQSAANWHENLLYRHLVAAASRFGGGNLPRIYIPFGKAYLRDSSVI